MSKFTDALRVAIEPLKFLMDKKVDSEPGKTLSTNDYTDRDKRKLDSLPTDILTKSEQILADQQKKQVRTNIGAIGSFNEIFYEINPYKMFISGTSSSANFSFGSSKVNDLAYGCRLSDSVGTVLWKTNNCKLYDDLHDVRYNPNVAEDVHTRLKYNIVIGSTIQIYFQTSGNFYQFQLSEASDTVRYIGNGFLYNTNLPKTEDTFCVTFNVSGEVYIYSKSTLWPGLDVWKPLDQYRIREWGLYYNDIAYAALDPKYIPNALPDVSREDSGKIPMVKSDGTWGLGETLTESRVNELISTALSAIPAAEEASF